MSGFQLRSLRVEGPQVEAAEVAFGTGLNVISGPSDTGKSYLVETIDFMLGGGTPPRQIPESQGYDRALLTIEARDGRLFTLSRSLVGGDFELRDHAEPEEVAPVTLGSRHSATSDNISTFLLQLAGLDQKRVRKNAQNELQNLSFRNIAHLTIIDEESIIKKDSPILSGDSTQRTAQTSVFKLLLTGLDDSSLTAVKKRAIAKAELEAQITLLDQIIEDYTADLKALTNDPADLVDQEARLDASILASEQTLAAERAVFESNEKARRVAWAEREAIASRLGEIDGLIERFQLLDESYDSDLQRLEAVAEAGVFFVALKVGSCPLCGAPAGDHDHDGLPRDGDIVALKNSCEREIAKIRQLRTELQQANDDLSAEQIKLTGNGEQARRAFIEADALVRETLAPALSAARQELSQLMEARSTVRAAIALADRIEGLRQKRTETEAALGTAGRVTEERPGLPAASLRQFSHVVEQLLDAWHFPHGKPVYFNEQEQDMVLGNRRRGEQGKGLRALTHAAFTLAIQEASRLANLPSTGFAVLDSPLVTFREADVDEEALNAGEKVVVKQAFYRDLAQRFARAQVIVVENEDPDPAIWDEITVHFFSKRSDHGRYGFFPHVATA